MDNLLGGDAGEPLHPLGPQTLGRLETAIGSEIVAEKAIDRTGDVAGDGIEGLVLAAKSVRTASVYDEGTGTPQASE